MCFALFYFHLNRKRVQYVYEKNLRMPRLTILSLSAILLITGCKTIDGIDSTSKPISHEQWTDLLQKHVNEAGWVDYTGFIADSSALNDYLETLSTHYPNEANWTRDEILAYWINAYNAYTIRIVIRNYPVASIKDIQPGIGFINSVWDIKFIHIEDQTLDLNNIEHNILRKMDEPRIHFAVNCASFSCPKLLNEAYVANRLDAQLDKAAKDFINDPARNKITQESATLSSIFNWFTGDFTKNGSLKDFINQYSTVQIGENTSISFMDYNWQLNKQ